MAAETELAGEEAAASGAGQPPIGLKPRELTVKVEIDLLIILGLEIEQIPPGSTKSRF